MGFDTRIYSAESNYVFVYRPVILEGTTGTYLIGWGDRDMVGNVKAWAKAAGECHMFLYPAIEVSSRCRHTLDSVNSIKPLQQNAGWYYLGLHSFSYASVEPVWHKLSKDVSNVFLGLGCCYS